MATEPANNVNPTYHYVISNLDDKQNGSIKIFTLKKALNNINDTNTNNNTVPVKNGGIFFIPPPPPRNSVIASVVDEKPVKNPSTYEKVLQATQQNTFKTGGRKVKSKKRNTKKPKKTRKSSKK